MNAKSDPGEEERKGTVPYHGDGVGFECLLSATLSNTHSHFFNMFGLGFGWFLMVFVYLKGKYRPSYAMFHLTGLDRIQVSIILLSIMFHKRPTFFFFLFFLWWVQLGWSHFFIRHVAIYMYVCIYIYMYDYVYIYIHTCKHTYDICGTIEN